MALECLLCGEPISHPKWSYLPFCSARCVALDANDFGDDYTEMVE